MTAGGAVLGPRQHQIAETLISSIHHRTKICGHLAMLMQAPPVPEGRLETFLEHRLAAAYSHIPTCHSFAECSASEASTPNHVSPGSSVRNVRLPGSYPFNHATGLMSKRNHGSHTACSRSIMTKARDIVDLESDKICGRRAVVAAAARTASPPEAVYVDTLPQQRSLHLCLVPCTRNCTAVWGSPGCVWNEVPFLVLRSPLCQGTTGALTREHAGRANVPPSGAAMAAPRLIHQVSARTNHLEHLCLQRRICVFDPHETRT